MLDSINRFDEKLLSLIKTKQNKKKIKHVIEKAHLYYSTDASGDTLLHIAAAFNNPVIVQYLIKHKSNIDAQNNNGKTPLILALEKKHQRIVKILLKSGANFEICDNTDRNAFQVAIDNIESMEESMDDDIIQLVCKKIQKECSNNYEKIANKLLDTGWPVYCIILLGNSEVTRNILERDCSINAYYTQGNRKSLMQSIETAVEEEICELLQDGSRKAVQRFPIAQEENNWWVVPHKLPCNGIHRKLYYEHQEDSNFELFGMKKQWKILALKHPGRTPLTLETQYAVACTIDYLLYDGTEFHKVIDKNCPSIYRKFKKFETHDELFKLSDSIFGVILKLNFFIFGELLLAYLALHETFGTPIAECIRSDIDTNNRLKNYFNFCKRLLLKEVYSSITLFKLLTENVEKLMYLAYDLEFDKAITKFNRRLKSESYYFHIAFQRKMEKVFMRKAAADLICKFMRIDYNRFPNIVDSILDYLTEQDIQRLWNLRHVVLREQQCKISYREKLLRMFPRISFRIQH